MDRRLISLAALAAASLFAAEARAEDQAGWHGSVTPYLWIAGMKGNVGALVDSPPIAVDTDFPGLFDKLSGAFMGKAEIGYGRFGVVGNIDYLKLSGDHNRQTANGAALGGEIESSLTEGTLAGYWRAYQGETTDVDLLAGGRYTKGKLEVDLSINGRSVSGSVEESGWDPVVGVRATTRLNDRVSLSGYADYGGGVTADSTWQLYGAVNYRFSDMISGSLGYRYYDMSLSKNGYDYDAQVGGPLLGLTFSF